MQLMHSSVSGDRQPRRTGKSARAWCGNLAAWLTALLLACCLPQVRAQAPAQTPQEAAKAKRARERYPLSYPPMLPDGQTVVTERSPLFLKPGPNLQAGVTIASTAPTVDFAYYPEQNYPGNPWSHRSDGIVVGDIYYSSSNDHLAPRGTALLWEYHALAKKFRLLCDTTKFLESVRAFPENMNYRPGEMQSRIDLGSDGWLYYATDRGSPTVTNDAHGYLGEWILRTHPQSLQTEIVITHPVEKHTIPASVLDPVRMILYCGTAVGKDAPNQNIQFFALDLKNRKILKQVDGGPTRTLIFSKSTGRVYWEGKMYDPATNQVTAATVPHVRSATAETPQGLVYGTSETRSEIWSFNVKTSELRTVCDGAVGSQQYIASIDADPTGRYLYYAPGAHGGASKDGTPVVQLDVQTGQKKVLAFLHELFWEKYGYALDGSFGSALDEKGERLFISWDGWRKGQPRGWESCSLTVLHIPASERPLAVANRAPPPEAARLAQAPVVREARAVRFFARDLIESSQIRQLQLSTDGSAILIQQGKLIEDDGPAAGFSYHPNEEVLTEGVRLKKELWIEDPRAKQSTLLLGYLPAKNGAPLAVELNGSSLNLKPAGMAGRYWHAFDFDPALLKPGKNEFVFSGSGKFWIAREDEFAAGSRTRPHHPNRSAKSRDHGTTWDDVRLGADGQIDGEYYVRLFLQQHHASGSLELPIIDLGNPQNKPIAPPEASVDVVRLALEGDFEPGQLYVRARSSNVPVPREATWSPWVKLQPGDLSYKPTGRFVQFALDLKTTDARQSPRLHSVTVFMPAQSANDWSANLQVTEFKNEVIQHSSIPFEYEPFDRPELAQLRSQYKLDEVVAGAKDEFELITRLAVWSSQCWQKGHLKEVYPAWSALEILKPHADGSPIGGFCQHYNLVLLQACESFGLLGRAVSIGQGQWPEAVKGSGHEVVEIWSNQFKKWVYVDGNCAWYAVDKKTQVPLSLLELRERQLAELTGNPGESSQATEIIRLAETSYSWASLRDWPPFLELRLIPRSNFLEAASPVPLNQGMRGWFWTGHHVWDDRQLPSALLYGNRVVRKADWEWTLNQARLHLIAAETPGRLLVSVEHSMPWIKSLMAEFDGKPAQVVNDNFTWLLHRGENRMKIYPRNTADRDGVASWVTLTYGRPPDP